MDNPFAKVAERVGLDRDLFRDLTDNAGRTPAEQIAASDRVAEALRRRAKEAGSPIPKVADVDQKRVVCPVCAGRGWTGDSPDASAFCIQCRGYKTIPARASSCPVCCGSGRVRASGATKARVVAVPCPACQRSGGAIARRAESSGIPPAYATWSLERWDALAGEDPDKSIARDLVGVLVSGRMDFARQTGRPGILFRGPVGTGKTGLAVAAGLELMRNGATVRFVVFDRLLDELRSTFSSDDPRGPLDVWSRYLGAEVLIVDDLGTRSDNAGWRTEQAYHLFDERLSRQVRGRVTLVTSNLSLEDVAKSYDERTASRLGRLCFDAPVEGEDLRRRDAWD